MGRVNRRAFLQVSSAAGAFATVEQTRFLAALPRVQASELRLSRSRVASADELEPLVRLLETTPRDQVLEKVADEVRSGVTYSQLLGALLLAGVRNIRPRPEVGFKFHAVLVVNSAHLAAQRGPQEHRWLPIFWAIDEFKSSQARDVEEGDWTMQPIDESALPGKDKALAEFDAAMSAWDEGRADLAAAALARHFQPQELFDHFCKFGARDFRSIGHKAIFVSNSFRALETIGWQHAEPVLRSLAFALLKHDGQNPAQADLPADQPGKKNLELAAQARQDWQNGQPDAAATRALWATLRESGPSEAPAQVMELLGRGVAPASVWDSLFCGAGELLLRQNGIVALHAVTTTNALAYAAQRCQAPELRLWLMLQNASFLTMFRQAMSGRGPVSDARLDALEPAAISGEGQSEILANLSGSKEQAARQLLQLGQSGTSDQVDAFLKAAQALIFYKGNNSHDYKFSSAVFDDIGQVSAEFRPYYLASSAFQLRGSNDADNPVSQRMMNAVLG